jgi:hypothetical protein
LSTAATSTGKTHWQKYWLLYTGASIAILLVLFFFPSEEKTVSSSVLAIARPVAGASLVATLQTNTLHGSRDEFITFEAFSDPATRIESMQACVSAPEFAFDPASGCIPVPVVNKSDLTSPHVQTTIRLTPQRSSGTVKVLITAVWVRYVPRPQGPLAAKDKPNQLPTNCVSDTGSCYPLAEKMAMTLGPIKLGINIWSRFAGRLSRFLKDLTLPIILILLANWLTREAAERDRRRDDKEKQLRDEKEEKLEREEEKRGKIEREQEEEKQISHILLPKVMRLSGNYYLPMTLHASKFVLSSVSSRAASSDLTFYLFSFFHVARSLKEKEGGVFFKEMAAEQIFKIANNTIRSFVVTAVGGEKQFDASLDHLDTWVSNAARRWPRLSERPDVVAQGWVDAQDVLVALDEARFQAIRFLFNVVAETMHYESNAPYLYWYKNSREENVFRLAHNIPTPPENVFGPQFAENIREFCRLLSIYRGGKEGQP